MLIRTRAPLRLGLAGGGTDVSPYCDIYGGYVLNAAIDRHAYTTLTPLANNLVRFIAKDQQEVFEAPLQDRYELTGQLKLHKAIYNYVVETFCKGIPIALEVSTFCEAPIGSGLGSSSTLVVAILRAYVEYLNLPLDDYAIANLAVHIERNICNFAGGRQDQYSAAFGGFNLMEFYADNRTIVNPLRIKNWILCELEASLVLYYTGVSRESAAIIKAQKDNVESGKTQNIEAMHGIKAEALAMKEALLRGDFDAFVQSMRAGWESKKSSAKAISNAKIDDIYDAAIKAGALAGKISGAGGGGFMLFFVPSEQRLDVERVLQTHSGVVSTCHFCKHGTQAWRIG